MRTPCRKTCGLVLSLLTLGGCSLLPVPGTVDEPTPAASSSQQQLGAQKVALTPEADAFSAADFEAIDNPDAAIVRQVQAALNEAGFPVGQPDGKIGKRTVHGVRLFKVARRMPVTNAITPALLTALAIPNEQ